MKRGVSAKMKQSSLNYATLTSILDYDKDTGIFTWKIITGRHKKIGDIAGWIGGGGYPMIGYKRIAYLSSRLAWLYIYGEWPLAENELDHINGIKTDNRICNLRAVTHRENLSNRKEHRNGKLAGAHFDKSSNRWEARTKINGKTKSLKMFDTEKEASEYYFLYIEGLNKLKNKAGV